MFLLALPAGAIVDIVDRRKFLIVGELATTVFAAVFAALVWLQLVTTGSLLFFTVFVGGGPRSPPPPGSRLSRNWSPCQISPRP